MEITGHNHLTALIGSLCFCTYLAWVWYNKKQIGLTDKTIKEYFSTEWDDYAITILFGQVGTFLQEGIYYVFLYVTGKIQQENVWDMYYDLEEIFAFSLGIYSIRLFALMNKKVNAKLKEHGE